MGDTIDPAGEFLLRIESVEMAIGLDKYVLQNIFGIRTGKV
jgi:hypothetical protein